MQLTARAALFMIRVYDEADNVIETHERSAISATILHALRRTAQCGWLASLLQRRFRAVGV